MDNFGWQQQGGVRVDQMDGGNIPMLSYFPCLLLCLLVVPVEANR